MKILWMSDSWHTISGFGSASRNIATYLHNAGHTVEYIGWQTFGQRMIATFHDKILGFQGLPNVGGKRFGEDAWKYWLPKVEPDVFITLSDFWMVMDLFKQNKLPYPWLMWYPIDGFPVTDQMKVMLKKLDYRVCISEYGAKLVREAGSTTGAVPHGVNTKIFKPYHKNVIREMKQKLGIPPNAFVVGRVDRNQKRKKVPRLMRAFVKFKKDFPESTLLLWMDKRDTEGWDLEFIAKRLGLVEGKDIFFPPPSMMANFMYGVPELELAHIMNTIDIHGWTTGGEGFGLTGLENMACGTVNVATDYTTPQEIFGDWTCGLPIKVETFEIGNAGVDRALVNIDDCYGQMKYLRENLDEMKVLSDAGVKRAETVYDWSVIGKQFDNYLRNNIV